MSGQITAAMVKELRDRTGVGMSKCKEALQASSGDMDEAIAYLRKAGMATAVKKGGREAKEGMITFVENDKAVVIVQVSAETDFVVQNENFQKFVENIANEVLETRPKDLDGFLKQQYSGDASLTIDEYRSTLVQSIGENIVIRRFHCVDKESDVTLGLYSHMKGKIVVLVELQGVSGEDELAKDVAMHVAAEAPEYLTDEDISEDIIEHEKDIARSQVKGKPENILDKIVEGKLNAYYDRVCLIRQSFVKDPDLTVGELVEKRAKELGKSLRVRSFLRWKIGE